MVDPNLNKRKQTPRFHPLLRVNINDLCLWDRLHLHVEIYSRWMLPQLTLKRHGKTGHFAQVVLMLVSMVYNLPGLDWSQPTDHAELFSGGMSVTIGELEAASAAICKDMGWENQPILTCNLVNPTICKLHQTGYTQG